MTHERLNTAYALAELRKNPHYTAGFYNFPYVGKTAADKLAFKLGRSEASSNILAGI